MKVGVNQIHAWVRQHHQVSEAALAATFAEHNGDKWRYNTDEGVWLQWVGTHWARQQTPELLDALRHFLVTFAKAFCRVGIITNAEAVKLQKAASIASVERICRALETFKARSVLFDSDPFQLGTSAGTVDLRTGETTPPNPDDHITILVPKAPAPPGTTLGPRFKKFLNDITNGDEDFQLTLQQWAGVSATGTARDQRILFIYGPGGNGKGVFLRTVAGLLGTHATNAPNDLLMAEKYSRHGTHLIDVIKARMALATEVDEDATWDVALVKNLTGGDVMQVNRMHKDPFWIKPQCSITISGNKKPMLKGVDDAVRRRFLVATFNLKLKPAEVIPDLEKEFIEKEGPAILRWIIDGAVAREQAGALHVAEIIRVDTEDYFEDENVLQDFIDTCLKHQKDDSDTIWRVETSKVFSAWRRFCEGLGRKPGAKNAFTTAMKAAGIKYERTKTGRYFINVHLKMEMEV